MERQTLVNLVHREICLCRYHICFAWTGEYESLKKLLSEDLKLTGIWGQMTLRSRGERVKAVTLLHLEGTDSGKITRLLCTKICEDLNAVSKTNNIIIWNCSCQTDICHDIEGLKSGQKVTSEAIQSLSKAVSHIAETFPHFQEDMHVKINLNRGNQSLKLRENVIYKSHFKNLICKNHPTTIIQLKQLKLLKQ